MKIISLLLSLCLSLNVLASSGTVQELERAFDEYHYAVTVEWDQKDPAFYKAQTDLFFSQMSGLIHDGGLTQADIMNFVEAKVADKAVMSDMVSQLKSQASSAQTTEELVTLLSQNSSHFYQQGASWDGRQVMVGAVVVTISALFVYGVFFAVKYGCVLTENGVKSYCTDPVNENHTY